MGTLDLKNNLKFIPGKVNGSSILFRFLSGSIQFMKTSGKYFFFLVYSFGSFALFYGFKNSSCRLGLCGLNFRTCFFLVLPSIECYFIESTWNWTYRALVEYGQSHSYFARNSWSYWGITIFYKIEIMSLILIFLQHCSRFSGKFWDSINLLCKRSLVLLFFLRHFR